LQGHFIYREGEKKKPERGKREMGSRRGLAVLVVGS